MFINVLGILLLATVSALGLSILLWFLKHYWCCRFRHNEHNFEEDLSRERQCGSNNDVDAYIPSTITISGRSFPDHRSRSAGVAINKQVINDRRFSRLNGRNHQWIRHGRNRQADSIETLSCDDMSLPDTDCEMGIPAFLENRTSRNNNNGPAFALSEDESYPNAAIQFRHHINGNGDGADQEGIDQLIDFLVNTEDYVRYPRSKLTILLRAWVPETKEDQEDFQQLRAIIEAASNSPPHPLQVLITTNCAGSSLMSSEENLLRCGTDGGFLVTFGSVRELPEDHPNFLKDLIF